nr:unnamed protein product [Callosobruchus analis]
MTNKSYHMRDVQRKLWQEVAVEMSVKVEDVKNKWRGLRDTFRKEFTKSKKRKSGDGAESVVTSKWTYYNMLLFLSETVARRKLHGSVSPQRETNSNSETESTSEAADNDSQSTIIEESSQQVLSTDTSQPITSVTENTSTFSAPSGTALEQRQKNTRNHFKYVKNSEKNKMDDKFLQIEKAKLEIFQRKNREESDSEHQCLMSLSPFLKAVPRNRQMLVRSKLQQVFVEEEELSTRQLSGPSCHYNEAISPPFPSPAFYTDTDSQELHSTLINSHQHQFLLNF